MEDPKRRRTDQERLTKQDRWIIGIGIITYLLLFAIFAAGAYQWGFSVAS